MKHRNSELARAVHRELARPVAESVALRTRGSGGRHCEKCGFAAAKGEDYREYLWLSVENANRYFGRTDEALLVACRRCRYRWLEPTLDQAVAVDEVN